MLLSLQKRTVFIFDFCSRNKYLYFQIHIIIGEAILRLWTVQNDLAAISGHTIFLFYYITDVKTILSS